MVDSESERKSNRKRKIMKKLPKKQNRIKLPKLKKKTKN